MELSNVLYFLDSTETGQAHRTILFPIRVGQAVLEVERGWPALVRNTRHIGDFTHWTTPQKYQQVFSRLLRDLKLGA